MRTVSDEGGEGVEAAVSYRDADDEDEDVDGDDDSDNGAIGRVRNGVLAALTTDRRSIVVIRAAGYINGASMGLGGAGASVTRDCNIVSEQRGEEGEEAMDDDDNDADADDDDDDGVGKDAADSGKMQEKHAAACC